MVTKRFIHRKNNNASPVDSIVCRNVICVTVENRSGQVHYISQILFRVAPIIRYNPKASNDRP